MTIVQSAFDRSSRGAMAMLLLVLLAYGVFSTPGLMVRWGASPGGVAIFVAWSLTALWALATTIRHRLRTEWIAFAVIAIGLRLGSAWFAAPRVSPGDSHWYLVLAHNLIAGRGLVVDEPFMGVACYALFPPLYGIVLAGWGAVVGFSTPSLLALSTLIDLGAAWSIVRLASFLGVRRAGIAAALVYLILPSVLFSAPLAQKEGLSVLLVLALAFGWLRAARDARRWRDALAIGLPAALLALTQPGEAMLALLFGLVLIPGIGLRRVMTIGMPAALIAVAVMLPWWIRNLVVLGAFVPLTSSAGYSLWIGNNADATGNWLPPPEQLRGLPEITFGKAAAGLAQEWIVQHPVGFVRITIAKFVRAVAIGEFGVVRLAAMNPPISAAIGALLLPVSHGAHLLTLAGGAAALRLRRDPAIAALAALLAACVVQLMLFGMWFEFGERHREFLTPFILIAVAVAVPHWARMSDSRRRQPAIA
ncbi:glycosyltransferase family 39 protein [Sphingomonas sp. So64.6b]|uniref:glycosyltransferase family 39 protein n=1 Tax=Sphingomonas sp. So64.6b TaxID=2997354 RepID=UPI001FCE620A|nr:glycosyltransferase family 39 protein [Sphingomonas sp. So64.6b]